VIDLSSYERVALQFSGGKDSLACLYLLKPQLDQLTVYWCDTGDSYPETRSIIDAVRSFIPKFVVIRSDVKGWRLENGLPSDLVPARSHFLGVAYGMSQTKISNRFDCCASNIMLPMHSRMLEDGVDLVIRGTKRSDTGKLPADGKTPFYDILLPIRDWTNQQVFEYLEKVGAPKNPLYEYFTGMSAPECLGCTAWWDDGKSACLKAFHQPEYAVYRENLERIAAEVHQSVAELRAELAV